MTTTARTRARTAKRMRESKAGYQRKLAESLRGIKIPGVKNRRRRDLKLFCETYPGNRFYPP